MNRALQKLTAFVSALVISLGVGANSAQAVYEQGPDAREERALAHLRDGDAAAARDLLLTVVADDVDQFNAIARYNLACAHARLGDSDAAVLALRDAVDAGFLDLHQIRQDRDLAPVHAHNAYVELVEEWPAIVEGLTDERVRSAMSRLGDGYFTESDERHRLVYLTVLDADSQAEMRQRLTGIIDAAVGELFGEGLDVPVLVVVPDPDDYRRLIDMRNIGGMYRHDEYQLISRTTGDSLQHELIHALHWADMDRLGQVHPIWVQEGLASVFEDVTVRDGLATPIPSWRTNIVKRLEQEGRLVSIEKLARMSRRRFLEFRPRDNYAQARAVFMYLASRDKLDDWYRLYTRTFEDDPTGVAALERALGASIRRVDRDFADWVADLPAVQEVVAPGAPSLGVVVDDLAFTDGVLIDDVHPGTGAAAAGLQPGDVIFTFNEARIARTRDLSRALGGLEVGDKVEVRVRRDGAYLSHSVELTAR